MNHYEILELAKNCHQSEIKKAYRNQVKKFHPDINPDPSSVDRMTRINEAYETLSDVTTRNLYDQYLNGVPVKTVIQETTPEQRYKAEYLRNKIKNQREQMEFQVKFKQKFYKFYRFANVLFFGLGILLSVDYFYQPIQKRIELEFIGRGRFAVNIITKEGLKIEVDKSFYSEYQFRKSDEIIVSYSSIFKQPTKVRVDGNFDSHTIQRTFYSFRNVFAALILIFSVFVIKHKTYTDFRLSCGLISFVLVVYVLLFMLTKFNFSYH